MLLDQAAGIVISLLVAFSLVALVAAGDDARGAARRRRAAPAREFGVLRALGFSPGGSRRARREARARRRCRRPRAGVALGALAVAGPAAGAARLAQRAAARLGRWSARCAGAGRRRGDRRAAAAVAGVARRAAAARGDPARRRARRRRAAHAGVRGGLAGSARGSRPRPARRWVAAVATIGVCAGVVTADARAGLAARAPARRPGRGRQALPADRAARPGGSAARCARSRASPTPPPRYAVDAADSFRLGKPVRLVAYRATTRDSRRRRWPPGGGSRGAGEIEVGLGLADALGLRPGSALAGQLPSGERGSASASSGVVRALENDGPHRLGPARPAPAADAMPSSRGPARRGADRPAVARALEELGATAAARRRRDDPQRASSSACSPRCCAASGSRSGSCACTRSCRRWR